MPFSAWPAPGFRDLLARFIKAESSCQVGNAAQESETVVHLDTSVVLNGIIGFFQGKISFMAGRGFAAAAGMQVGEVYAVGKRNAVSSLKKWTRSLKKLKMSPSVTSRPLLVASLRFC